MAGAGIAGAGIAGIGDEWGMVPLNCATVAPLDITTTAAAATTVLAILSMPVFPSWAECRVIGTYPSAVFSGLLMV
jgi:hypothetical protein